MREPSEEVRGGCEGRGWRYVKDTSMYGSEDDCIVTMGGVTPEYISRARKLLVMVVTRGKEER